MIKAKIVADSISSVNGKRITTFEVEFPRLILAEWNTHRLFSRNAASTRAIPILKQLAIIAESPAMPVFYGKNQSGMVANEEVDDATKEQCKSVIKEMLSAVTEGVTKLNELGLHKQHSGRYLEPWMHVKGVVTSTEWDNFFWLRKHPDSQPEIRLLAEKMWEALKASEPQTLLPGMWHLPYVDTVLENDESGSLSRQIYFCQHEGEMVETCLENALAISSSCCAQVSYRKLDDSLEKAKSIFEKLIESKPCHASPTEHQATPMKYTSFSDIENGWEEGVTHMDKQGYYWSGNLRSWVQHRQLLEDHTCWNFSKEK